MKDYQVAKLAALLMGQKQICSDEDLNLYHAMEGEIPYVRSIPNPNQVGTKDAYLCWIEPCEEVQS